MNTYKKFCPNVFVAQCETEHQRGDIIQVTTKYGKENEHVVHNLVGRREGMFFYSITRADGLSNQDRAKQRVERLNSMAESANKKGENWQEKSNEGRDFLSLGEPIKVGHHSEKRHRALIDRNWKRMSNAMDEFKKADTYRERTAYWDAMAKKTDLSMPESVEFFEIQLEEAKAYHKAVKDGNIPKEHSFSLAYANKKVKDLTEKHRLAVLLWA